MLLKFRSINSSMKKEWLLNTSILSNVILFCSETLKGGVGIINNPI